jgi:hypothetical protein
MKMRIECNKNYLSIFIKSLNDLILKNTKSFRFFNWKQLLIINSRGGGALFLYLFKSRYFLNIPSKFKNSMKFNNIFSTNIASLLGVL